MADVTEPELNRQERWTRDYILPILPSGFEQPAEVSDERLNVVRSILAQEYVEHAKLDVLWKTTGMLLAYDLGFRLNSVVYGLVIGVLGSLALTIPDLYTPVLLAEEAFDENHTLASEIRRKAERSVKTNVGVAGLAIGFSWQIFTISGPIPPELLSQNYLYGEIPAWMGLVVVLTTGYLLLGNGITDLRA